MRGVCTLRCHRGALFTFAAALAILIAVPGWGAVELRSERMVAPGVKHIRLYRPEGPWAIQVLEIDTKQNCISLGTTLAGDRIPGLEPVSGAAARVSRDARYVVAGVNGDYFARNPLGFQGGPLGFQVLGGELVSSPAGRSALIVRSDGSMSICRPTLEASAVCGSASFNISAINRAGAAGELVLYTRRFGVAVAGRQGLVCAALQKGEERLKAGAFELSVGSVSEIPAGIAIPESEWLLCGDGAAADFLRGLAVGQKVTLRIPISCAGEESSIAEAIGGGPVIVREGAACIEYQQENFTASFAQQRHPRTAVGIDGRRLVLVAVDGRQEPYSVGMTLDELAALMVELGCKDALNLDGGGSTTIWVRGKVSNSPSDGTERAVANSLLVFSSAPVGPAARLVIESCEIRTIAGQAVPLAWHFEDENYNPVSSTAQPKWEAASIGKVDDSGRFVADATRPLPARGAVTPQASTGTIAASAAGMTATAHATVYSSAAALRIFPASAYLEQGQVQKFVLFATDENGLPLTFDPASVKWEGSSIGEFTSQGVFRAASDGRDCVRARLGGQSATAAVVVGRTAQAAQAVAVEDFESEGKWSYSSWPTNIKGTFGRIEGGMQGKWAGRLEYDFAGATVSSAAYAHFDKTIASGPCAGALSAWIRGDGKGHWLRARLHDDKGEKMVVNLARRIDWKDEWRRVSAALPSGRSGLVLETIYLVETDPARMDAGRILLDNIAIETGEMK